MSTGGGVMLSRGWSNTPLANLDRVRTDADGFCRVSGETDAGESYFGAGKRGIYYDSKNGDAFFSEHSILKFGRWLPDDLTVTVRIDRVVRPIPLLAKRVGGGASIHLGRWRMSRRLFMTRILGRL